MNEKEIEVINFNDLDSNSSDIETIEIDLEENNNKINLEEFKILKLGDNLTEKKYVTNPAIAREEEIKKLITRLSHSRRAGGRT